jgi:CheY-like chemotaxis protein
MIVTTWMLVEDEPLIYEMMNGMFELWGIEGMAFVDGSEAVSWIEAVDSGQIRSNLPTLALLDIRLPTLSGPEVGARLRASAKLGNIVIVLITAYSLSDATEHEAIQLAQADALIYKPLPDINEFRVILETLLEKRAAALAVASPSQAIPLLKPLILQATRNTPSP